MIRPGKLLSDLKWTVALRGLYIVYLFLVFWWSPVESLGLSAGIAVAPLWVYAVYQGLMQGFGSKIEVLKSFVLPYALFVGVLALYRFSGRPVVTGLAVFAVFAVYRGYLYWDTIKDAKKIARMIRKTNGGSDD